MTKSTIVSLIGSVLVMAFTAPAFAEGDADKGKKVFRKCKACHVVDSDKNKVGPTLQNVMGRKPGAVEGFKYSDAMMTFGEDNVWDAETMDAFLKKPSKAIKGTKMKFAGLRKDKQRADVIAYLMSVNE